MFVTDPSRTRDTFSVVENLPRGSGVIYRHFEEGGREAIAKRLRQLTWRRGICLLIGNDPDLALRVKADGVHWTERNLASSKYWRDRFSLMTGAAHSRRAIAIAGETGLDAALVSTVFASESASALRPIGPIKFRQFALTAPLPIYALGGVTAENAGRISGVAGIAAVSGIENAFGKI